MADTVPTETLSLNYEKVERTYSKSDAAEDSFDFKGERDQDETAGLLLPAVQTVREPSTLPPDEVDPKDSFDFTAAPEDGESALLLPAVQQVREAARRSDTDDGVKMGDGAVIFIKDTVEAGETAYEVKLDDLMIKSYDTHGAGDSGHDDWIDVLSIDYGVHGPAAVVKEAGLRSDGELVQAVSEADMGGDFIL